MAKYLSLLCCLCLLVSFTLVSGVEHIISSDRTTNWGVWGSVSRCPTGNFVVSWTQKVEPDQGIFTDDTALNAIRMNCAPASNPNNVTQSVSSTEGQFGNWGALFSCVPSFISGFNLKVESDQGPADDTATNNFRGICSDGRAIDGVGERWGSWRSERYCDYRHSVCGIQTQVEPDGSSDDTAMNNVNLLCCPLPNLAETCIPKENYRTAAVCDNTKSKSELECEYSYNIGVGYAPGSEYTGKGWEGSGFTLKDAVKDLPKTFEKNFKDEKVRYAFTEKVFSEQSKVSNVVTVPAGVKSTISYLTADCAHYSVATRKIRREDVSKSGQVVAVTYFDI